MEMTYNEALVMPKNYAIVNEDEMTYVDGGWCIERHWWGHNIYLTHSECQALISDCTAVSYSLKLIFTKGTWLASLALSAVKYMLKFSDDGNGVRIRFTFAVYTGMFSLSRSEEKNTASKNRII